MSGAATLTRPPAAPTASRVPRTPLPPPLRVGALRGALLLGAWAAALLAVGCSRELVTSFGGTVKTLGSVNPYLDDGAVLLGWVLAAAAVLLSVRAAVALRAGRRTRASLWVALAGAVLLVAGSACSLWAVAIANQPTHSKGWLSSATKVLGSVHDVETLSRAAFGLSAAGWLVLASAVVVAVAGTPPTANGRARRVALVTLAVGFALLALGQAAELRYYWSPTTSPGHVGVLLVYGATALGFLVVAGALVLCGAALRRSGRTRALAAAAPLAALGALCLAAWSATVLAYAELLLSSSGTSDFATLSKLGSATEWAGYVILSLAAGIAAALVSAPRMAPRLPERAP